VVGVRPQDCEPAGSAATPSLSAEVKVFENLLEYGLGTLTVSGTESSIVAQTGHDADWRAGQAVRITVPPQRVYLFDPATGARIR
jgi:ABC-type sugar transport system ATPase subunit